MMYATTVLVAGLALSTAYRLDHQLGRNLITVKAQETAQETAQGSPRCQYSAAPSAVESGRPYHKSLIAICAKNSLTAKCQEEATSSAAKVLVADLESIGVSDCENLCNENFGMAEYRNKLCRGYVVRNPFNFGIEKGKAQCWLIHGNATTSKTFKTEVKIERSTLLDNKDTKITHFKEFCGCEARVVHFPRQDFRTKLALKRHELKQLIKEMKEKNKTNDGNMKVDKVKLKEQVKELELEETDYARLNTLEGVYDWLPIRVPHRIAKHEERLLPGAMAKWFAPGLIRNQDSSWKRYWSAPVRMSKIYKKSDLSAFLYLCLDKKSNQEDWYLARRDDMMTWAAKTFRHLKDQSEEEVSEKMKDEEFLKKAFFRMGCWGVKVGRDNKVTYKVTRPTGNKTITEWLDRNFWKGEDLPTDSNVDMSLTPFGCYENAKKAQDAVEEQVLQEVGKCPIQELSTIQTSKEEENKVGFMSFFYSDDNAMGGLNKAKFLVEKAKLSSKVTKWVSRGYSWWQGEKDTNVKRLHDYTDQQVNAMLDRTTVLLGGISKLWLVMDAAGNTDDLEIKSVCAREVLDQIFEVGGLMPKVSQNLAMRPDLVKDDFVRNKLKETQNANPSRDKAGTMEYLKKHNPTISLPNITKPVPLLELLEYKKALSAGSVGQVDLFTVRKDAEIEWRWAFKASLPKGHGDTVIIKTVFEETEAAYLNDWNLLELFFSNCGDNCDAKTRVMWKILEPMKKSIFDEFNLMDEAGFTMRGKAMLEEFTRNIEAGEYKGVLEPGSIKLTTPNAIATSSKYILIQSMASGTPLKNFLEDHGGQIEPLVDWRQKIYSAILMVYGHMVVKHGFFQSDPHNGNWFWEPETKTVTLIDWGGVGTLDQDTHCKLANLYSHLGKLTKAWSDCEAVELQGEKISGTYHRAGFSIYQAAEGQQALFYGRTYGISYFNRESGLRLFYDDSGKWKVVREHPGKQELTQTMAELETKKTNMMDLAKDAPVKWSFLNEKGKVSKTRSVTARMKDASSCNLPTRPEAYSLAAYKMGLGLNFACEAEDTVVIPEAPLTEDEEGMDKWVDNGKRQLGCITRTEEETFLEWGLYTKRKLMVETKDGKRTVELPDNKTYDLDAEPKEKPAEAWVLKAFNQESSDKIAKLSVGRKNMLLNAAQAQLAVATSLYDSDILMAAVLGLQAKGSVGLVTPDVPDEYVLLARCIVVFHGMLGDVLKDNFVRFVVTGQQDYIQWLVRSGGDRFFRSWLKPAEEFAQNGKCPVKDWKDLDVKR